MYANFSLHNTVASCLQWIDLEDFCLFHIHLYAHLRGNCVASLVCDSEIIRMPSDARPSGLCGVQVSSHCCMPSIVSTAGARASAHRGHLQSVCVRHRGLHCAVATE